MKIDSLKKGLAQRPERDELVDSKVTPFDRIQYV
jgi:hypothetical protein